MSWLDEHDEPRFVDRDATAAHVEVRISLSNTELAALRRLATRAFDGALCLAEVSASKRLLDALEGT